MISHESYQSYKKSLDVKNINNPIINHYKINKYKDKYICVYKGCTK